MAEKLCELRKKGGGGTSELTYKEGGSVTSKTLSLEVGKTYIIMVAFNSSSDYINPIPTIDWVHSTNFNVGKQVTVRIVQYKATSATLLIKTNGGTQFTYQVYEC